MVYFGNRYFLRFWKEKVVAVGWPWLDARCPPKLIYHSPPSAAQGRENTMKGSWVEIRTRRDHSPITVTDKTDPTQEN